MASCLKARSIAVLDALQLTTAHQPPFPPNIPAVIAQMHSPLVASDVKLTLMANYADNHKVHLVHGAGTPNPLVEDLPLYEIDHSQNDCCNLGSEVLLE